MNFTERNVELDKARALSVQISQAETRLDAMDDEEDVLKNKLQEAQKEFNALIKVGRKPRSRSSDDPRQVAPSRVMVLMDEIYALQQKINALAHAPSIIQNDLRRLGSDLDGFRARDWWWLKTWRDGKEKGMNSPVDVEDETQCTMWLNELQVHLDTFPIGDSYGRNFITKCEDVLASRRRNLVEGRARNAETNAQAARLHAEIATEKAERAKENQEKLAAFDKQRAEFRAQLDREMAEAKVAASLAFDRRVARKEVKRHAWLAQYWTKIAKARDDKDFRKEWLEKVSAKNPERGVQLQKVFRSAGDSASALRGAEQFDLIRQRWARVVELLDADPTLTMDQAEDVADPEYREQREEIKEREEERLAAYNADQLRQFG